MQAAAVPRAMELLLQTKWTWIETEQYGSRAMSTANGALRLAATNDDT